jgi:hypothetical protein
MDTLDEVARSIGPRVVPVALKGDVEKDAKALRKAALHSLHQNGRLVLMGGMNVP